MLQVKNDAIYEQAPETVLTTTHNGAAFNSMYTNGSSAPTGQLMGGMTGAGATVSNCAYLEPYYYWHSYPVYICQDKTKKAIEVLKALEDDGLKVASVRKFIALVEKISAIL